MKIYLAGHTGLVGSAIAELIETQGKHEWVGQTREQLDLLDADKVEKFIKAEKPDAIILAAARVGGIKANTNFPVEFLSENLQIQNNVINSSHKANVEKFVFLGSSCIYPKMSPQPIKEEYLLTGPLEPTNEPYALAKIIGLKLINAYRIEFQKKWISVMPTNIYGPRDNFDLETSHVLPALIRKIHDAKLKSDDVVELWGTGNPLREFLYSEDLADAVLFLLENYNSEVAINIGTGVEVKISELSSMIAKVVGFNGEIRWDHEMPDGTPRKLLDSSKIFEMGWLPKTDLETGIEKTYNWFLKNFKNV